LRPRKEELVATPVSTPALRHVITPLHWFLLLWCFVPFAVVKACCWLAVTWALSVFSRCF